MRKEWKAEDSCQTKRGFYDGLEATFGRQDWDQGFQLETWKQATPRYGRLHLADH